MKIHLEHAIIKVEMQKDRIVRVELEGRGSCLSYDTQAVVDATGNGAVVHRCNPDLFEAHQNMMSGLTLRLRGLNVH